MNWAGQEPDIVETMDRLVKDADACEAVLAKGNNEKNEHHRFISFFLSHQLAHLLSVRIFFSSSDH